VKLGLIGYPVGHSLSPALHAAALAALGVAGEYRALSVPPGELPTAVRGLHAAGYRGVNVTVPHKQAVLALLDAVTADAREIGAVNTIVVAPDGRLLGANTDWSGFAADLDELGLSVRGRRVAVLGAGGAARAVVYALARAGARVAVYSRDVTRAQSLVGGLRAALGGAELSAHALGDLAGVDAFDLVVNATSAGMAPQTDVSPWPEGLPYPRSAALYDLVYAPAVTRLMEQADAAGAPAYNGLGMLVQQAARSSELWTGRTPPLEAMRAAAALPPRLSRR
jgi:shikimate dehydrogenase